MTCFTSFIESYEGCVELNRFCFVLLKKKIQILVEMCTEPGISANICEMEIVNFLFSCTNYML